MSRTQRGLLVVLGAVALFVVVLALRTRKPPFLPTDAQHASFDSGAACLACHGPDGAIPQTKKHPLGNDCLRCHASR